MDNTTVNTLNDLLKGEEMAISSYAKFIQETTDETLIEKFKEIQKEHNEHAKLISERILDLGGTPKQGTGMAGVMADVKYAFEAMTGRSNHEILKEAWHGEDQGVAMSEKVADDKLDEESKKLIHHIVQHDHTHIKALEKLLEQDRKQ